MTKTEASEPEPADGGYQPVFSLYEYAVAEQRFVHAAVDALARTRDGLYGQIKVEPASRVQTTQITTDEGVVVEQPSVAVPFRITINPDDVINGQLESLLVSLDEAADEWLGVFMPQFFEYLGKVSEATGNVVDAKKRPFFDSFYEMIEKVEMDFDEDGKHNTVLVVHPETWKVMEEKAKDITPEQQKKLDDLYKRKREEANARRRHRRIP